MMADFIHGMIGADILVLNDTFPCASNHSFDAAAYLRLELFSKSPVYSMSSWIQNVLLVLLVST